MLVEKDLENIIMNADQETLFKRGLDLNHFKKKNQVKIGNYGRADIVAIDKPYIGEHGQRFPAIISVYELKKEALSLSAFLQAVRYAKGLQRYFEKRNSKFASASYRIVLIGKDVPNNDLVYLPDIFGYTFETNYCGSVEIYSYSYDINVLHFSQVNNIQLINEGF